MIIRENTSDARANSSQQGKEKQHEKPWSIVIRTRLNQRSYTYQATATDGHTQVSLYGARVSSLYSFGQLKAGFLGLRDVLEWSKHLNRALRLRIVLPQDAHAVLLGEELCPRELKRLRTQLLKSYFLRKVTIESGDLPPTVPAEGRIAA